MADERAPVANGREGEVPRGSSDAAPPPDPKKGNKMRLRIAAGVLLAGIVVLLWWLHERKFEETDDAQIDGNITAISARVPGTVVAVHVVDNQQVKAGDPLVDLDPADLEVTLAQARANVAQAQAAYEAENPNVAITVTSNRAQVQSTEDDVADARADLLAAQRDLDQAEAQDRYAQSQRERARQLVASKTISPADYDQRVSAADVTKANVEAARHRIAQKRAQLSAAESRLKEARQNAPRQLVSREAGLQVRKANLELAQAQLRQAQLNMGYAKITAPTAGIVGKKSVNVGERVQTGQQLLALTQIGDLWVTANFRETQIEGMKVGQPAEVHVDSIDKDYRGTVESFAGATGSRYSLLPPENASGNYVKVVQRVPVRIRLDPGQPGMERLRPGMSVEPKVRVR
ncbi:MAG: HlyD family secretion protein [Myxococcales bacterium]